VPVHLLAIVHSVMHDDCIDADHIQLSEVVTAGLLYSFMRRQRNILRHRVSINNDKQSV